MKSLGFLSWCSWFLSWLQVDVKRSDSYSDGSSNSSYFGGVSGTIQPRTLRSCQRGIGILSILNLNSYDRRTRVYLFPSANPSKEGIRSRFNKLSVDLTHSNSIDFSLSSVVFQSAPDRTRSFGLCKRSATACTGLAHSYCLGYACSSIPCTSRPSH